MNTPTELIENLRAMLQDVFRLKQEGVAYARLARAHGYIDGYMRVLIETGVAKKGDLLKVVAEERHQVDGPATALVGRSEAAA